MEEMMLHSGGMVVTLDDLNAVPLPEETASYKPVSHYDLITNVQKVASDLLSGRGYRLDDAKFGMAKEGQRMFFALRYRNGNDEMGYCIAGRNSYDKSMSVGMAFGAKVFVCDNLALAGEIVVMRKHTLRIDRDLPSLIIPSIYQNLSSFDRVVEDAERLKRVEITLDEQYGFIGQMMGHDRISIRQAQAVIDEINAPSFQYDHEETYGNHNAWSLYQAFTHVYKELPPHRILEEHVRLHETFRTVYMRRN